MDITNAEEWDELTPEERKRRLYEKQVAMLDTLLEHGTISRQQHIRSLKDMTEKMGFKSCYQTAPGLKPEKITECPLLFIKPIV